VQLDNYKNQQIKSNFKEILDKSLKQDDSLKMEDKELKEVSEEFESIFVGMMFKQMKNTVVKSDFLDSGLSQDIFEDMYYDEVAKEAAKGTKFGIAEAVYRQLSKGV